MNFDKGNVTTIIKLIVMTVAPALAMSEATANAIISIITGIVGLVLGYYDAKYDNDIITQPKIQDVSGEENDTA